MCQPFQSVRHLYCNRLTFLLAALLIVIVVGLFIVFQKPDHCQFETHEPYMPPCQEIYEVQYSLNLSPVTLDHKLGLCNDHSRCVYKLSLAEDFISPGGDQSSQNGRYINNIRHLLQNDKNASSSNRDSSKRYDNRQSKGKSIEHSSNGDSSKSYNGRHLKGKPLEQPRLQMTTPKPDTTEPVMTTPKDTHIPLTSFAPTIPASIKKRPISIALALGITSAKMDPQMDRTTMLRKFPTFRELLPSFCHTASCGFSYHFYFAYDNDDKFFTNPVQNNMFQEAFRKVIDHHCPNHLHVTLHMIQCSHSAHPAWAQNDAGWEAYLDHRDYTYRINDDTCLLTKNWTEHFIDGLARYDPPNVGVVGPDHTGGYLHILTYDFTHHTHQDIFGFYYPRMFTDWTADRWISFLYRPGRSTKLKSVRLFHSMSLGRRYQGNSKIKQLGPRKTKDAETLLRYLKSHNETIEKKKEFAISMSLYGSEKNYTYGAIRNAQLRRVFFPEWSFRIYLPHPKYTQEENKVPEQIVKKLIHLGADVYYVNTSQWNIPLKYMNLLVTHDNSVERFLIRHANQRLDDRQKEAVDDWIKSSHVTIHCMRDHPQKHDTHIVPGLVAIKNRECIKTLGKPLLDLVQELYNEKDKEFSLEQMLWDTFSQSTLCHDSTGCEYSTWASSAPFPTNRESGETFIGENYSAYHYSLDEHLRNVTRECLSRHRGNMM